MGEIQIIRSPSGEEMVVLPKAEYDRLLQDLADALEDAEDILIYDARKAALQPEDRLPASVSAAILHGDSRFKALRDYRGLSLAEAARSVGLTAAEYEAIEQGHQRPTPELVSRLAQSLSVPPSWIAN